MVFNLTAKKKRSYKVLPKPKKYAPVQHAHNVLHQLPTSQQSHDTPDPAMYRKLSSTRAIFESNKLESACSFLKSLKEKLENDIDGNGDDILLDRTPTNDTITSILDTLIDVSDNISPIVSDVSESTKSIYRRPTPMQSSSISEKHFNKTMLATNKLIELSTRSKNAADVTGGTYYFAHKIVANNMEELSIFKHSIMSIGDKIYIDKSLLAQMVELHTLLKDTITKLKLQEAECLSGSKANDESLTNHLIADDITSTPSKNVELGDSQKPTTSTPTSQSVTKLTADVSSITENARNSTLCYTAPTNIPVATKKISPSNTPPSKKKTKIPCFKKKKSPTTISFPSKKEPTTKKPNTCYSAAKTKSASATTDKIQIANASTTPQEFLVTGSPTSSILTTDKMNKKQLKNTELEPAQVLSVGKMRSKYETALDSTDLGTNAEEESVTADSSEIVETAATAEATETDRTAETPNIDKTSEIPITTEGLYTSRLDHSTNYSSPDLKDCLCGRDQGLAKKESFGTMTPTGETKAGAVKSDNTLLESRGIITLEGGNSKLVGTTSKQTTFYEPAQDISKDFRSTAMKDHRTQTPVHYIENISQKSMGTSTVLDYFEGLQKCVAELECMSQCLRNAAISKNNIHDCIKIFPESEQELLDPGRPHFHTAIDNVPVIIQLTKNGHSPDRNLKTKCCKKSCVVSGLPGANTCCNKASQERKQPFASRLFSSISKTAQAKCPQCWGSLMARPSSDNISPKKTWVSDKWKRTTQSKGKDTEKGDYVASDQKSKLSFNLSRKHKDKSSRYRKSPSPSSTSKRTVLSSNIVDSQASLPYVTADSSLPKLDDPAKVCSSLQFEIRSVPVTFQGSSFNHPNKEVKEALKDVTIAQLLDSFRPAKCCRKSVLNEKPHRNVPYAASLQSLPLQDHDLQIIHNTVQSNVQEFFKQQTLFEYYVNFQKNIGNCDKDKILTSGSLLCPQPLQIYFFELFKKEESKSNTNTQNSEETNHPVHDLRILNFIKRIYTTEPILEKKVAKKARSKTSQDNVKEDKNHPHTNERDSKGRKSTESICDRNSKLDQKPTSRSQHHHHHHHHHHHQKENKYKKTETKSFYSSVESYSTSKTDFHVNSSSSNISSKCTKIRNSDSTMYSYLLIPKNELENSVSNNDLSTSYAPSVTSLPFEDDEVNTNISDTTENHIKNTPNKVPAEDSDDENLSPKNYAKTLNGIYELDENGNIRTKGSRNGNKSTENIEKDTLLNESCFEVPYNTRNLSTIYEIDERLRESESNVNRRQSSKTFNVNRSRNISPPSNVTIHVTASERSRIPVSVHSYSASSLTKERMISTTRFSKTSISNKTSLDASSRSQHRTIHSPNSSKASLRSKTPSIHSQNLFRTSDTSQCKRKSKICTSSVVSVETSTSTKNLVAKVHPKVLARQKNISTQIKSIELQPALDGSNNLELPITFDIVQPLKNRNRDMKMETNVMSFDMGTGGSVSGVREKHKELRCYRSENMCVWPQLQKKFEMKNKAFFTSVHASRHRTLKAHSKFQDTTTQAAVLQQYPYKIHHSTAQEEMSDDKFKRLSLENFIYGGIGCSKRDKKKYASTEAIQAKHKESIRRHQMCPEVIDIKVSRNVKSTKLKDRFLKNENCPGYVTVLSPPCHCPDITIFLPCCCGHTESCTCMSGNFSAEAHHYAMVPIVEKGPT